jgi:hypothetical protein
MLADVDAGSDTPSLVGSVLKWRQAKPDEGLFHLFDRKPLCTPSPGHWSVSSAYMS